MTVTIGSRGGTTFTWANRSETSRCLRTKRIVHKASVSPPKAPLVYKYLQCNQVIYIIYHVYCNLSKHSRLVHVVFVVNELYVLLKLHA